MIIKEITKLLAVCLLNLIIFLFACFIIGVLSEFHIDARGAGMFFCGLCFRGILDIWER